jgi:hypothetical protein
MSWVQLRQSQVRGSGREEGTHDIESLRSSEQKTSRGGRSLGEVDVVDHDRVVGDLSSRLSHQRRAELGVEVGDDLATLGRRSSEREDGDGRLKVVEDPRLDLDGVLANSLDGVEVDDNVADEGLALSRERRLESDLGETFLERSVRRRQDVSLDRNRYRSGGGEVGGEDGLGVGVCRIGGSVVELGLDGVLACEGRVSTDLVRGFERRDVPGYRLRGLMYAYPTRAFVGP